MTPAEFFTLAYSLSYRNKATREGYPVVKLYSSMFCADIISLANDGIPLTNVVYRRGRDFGETYGRTVTSRAIFEAIERMKREFNAEEKVHSVYGYKYLSAERTPALMDFLKVREVPHIFRYSFAAICEYNLRIYDVCGVNLGQFSIGDRIPYDKSIITKGFIPPVLYPS